MKRTPLLLVTVSLAVLAAACGGGDGDNDAATDARTVEIAMRDIEFEPTSVDVERGETVRFVFTNEGAVAHDAFVGDDDAQAEHEETMSEDDGGMDHGGGDDDDGNAITVEPGDTGELTYTFDTAGSLLIGCHQPGHYDAGMILEVNVT